MNTLQKTLLSAVTIVSFSFYAFFLRTQDAQIVTTAASAETANNGQQNSGSAPVSSSDFQTYVDQVNAAAAQQRAAQSQAAADAQAQQAAAQKQAAAQAQADAQSMAQQRAAQEQAAAQAAAQAKQQSGQYRNGTYTGPSVDVFYGYVQVEAVIQNGQIADVRFLQYPNDRSTSVYINNQAMPLLKQEAIQAQSANINGVSGASATSQGFAQSLGDALSQAHV